MSSLDENLVAVVDAPRRLYRVGRDTNPIAYSYITPDIDADDKLGYRFDVLGAGVMYASTVPLGAYTETVQNYRLTASTYAACAKAQPGLMVSGNLPADWRDHRRLIGFSVPDGLPFLDVDASDSHTALTRQLGAELAGLGFEHLDIAVVRSNHRLVTRLIATWSYLQTMTDGSPRYSGIRFVSKLGHYECWALFEGVPIADVELSLIRLDDLQAACKPLGVWAH